MRGLEYKVELADRQHGPFTGYLLLQGNVFNHRLNTY